MKRNIIELEEEEKKRFLRNLLSWTSEKLAIESMNKLNEYIKTGEGINFVESYLLGQILLSRDRQSSFFDDLTRMYKDNVSKALTVSAPSLLINYLFNGKMFKLTEPVYNLLKNTNNRIFLRKHPFYVFAIDQKIQTKYDGLNIIFTMFFEVGDEKEAKGCNYLVLGRDERDNSEFYITGDINTPSSKNYPGVFTEEEHTELHNKTKEIYSNFLDYLNHPYAKQSIYVLSNNTKERIKRGKFPRQDKIIIDIKQEFIQKVEVNKEEETKDRYNYKFWVRGHFKHFRNKERFKKLYILSKTELEKKKLFYNGDYISRWIIPYIKGVGKIKEKIRRLS